MPPNSKFIPFPIPAIGAKEFRSAFDWMGRALPLAFPTLELEQWARGMVELSRESQSRPSRRGEPDLGGRHGSLLETGSRPPAA
jgi:hypothetical protein